MLVRILIHGSELQKSKLLATASNPLGGVKDRPSAGRLDNDCN
jgi:hypothetical protein